MKLVLVFVLSLFLSNSLFAADCEVSPFTLDAIQMLKNSEFSRPAVKKVVALMIEEETCISQLAAEANVGVTKAQYLNWAALIMSHDSLDILYKENIEDYISLLN